MPVPPGFFLAASDDQRDVDHQKAMSDRFESYINRICAAICSGWSTWQSAATLVDVQINAFTATGGKLTGPPLYGLIIAQAPFDGPWFSKRSEAIANGVDKGFYQYQASVRVPGLPWYPAFACVPSPVAPPAPNVPCPLLALNGMRLSLTASALKELMLGKFGASEDYAAELFDAVATAVAACFETWVMGTIVTNVMGSGPVPTFAPPYVPVGPVVGGTGTMIPGGLV
jgi:hypothetical protein